MTVPYDIALLLTFYLNCHMFFLIVGYLYILGISPTTEPNRGLSFAVWIINEQKKGNILRYFKVVNYKNDKTDGANELWINQR